MRQFREVSVFSLAMALVAVTGMAVQGKESHVWTKQQRALTQEYVQEEMPPGFQVVIAEVEGPVFADASGKTLYIWPVTALRNGNAGELKGRPTCDATPTKVTTGLQSPYPGGLELPEVSTRPSCVQVWPPVLADASAKPVGKWTILDGPGGRKQWAYDGQALYTSVLDKKRGDNWGQSNNNPGGDSSGASREPAGPPPNIPPQFAVKTYKNGRLLTLADTKSIYVYDKDAPNKSNCTGVCLEKFTPVLAPENVLPQGAWSIIERSSGVKQWAYRKQPVYTYNLEDKTPSFEGGDEPGWRNVFTQLAPAFPKGFQITDTNAGQVLADAKGRTIYLYNCNDDATDQLDCSHPSQPQAYRLALCGKGDWKRCQETFPYLLAGNEEKSESQIWSIKYINAASGRWVEPGDAGALRVWAYRDRPVYLCGRDRNPGDFDCDGWGEFSAGRNGWKAFWIRDVYGRNGI
jgi:predicted lipoprotein with Yx(FWY)xxD motif